MSMQYIIFVYTHFGLWSQQILLPTFFRSKILAEKKMDTVCHNFAYYWIPTKGIYTVKKPLYSQ